MSLFVACWFAAIGAFRSSLLFRLFRLLDVIRMKSYMDSLFDPTCVPVKVTINKLNFFPNRKMPHFVSVLRNCGGLCTSKPHISVVFLSCLASLSLFPRCILCRTHMESYRRHRLAQLHWFKGVFRSY